MNGLLSPLLRVVDSYKDCKFEAVTEALRKANAELLSSSDEQTLLLALLEDELKQLDELAATLSSFNTYHTSNVTDAQLNAVQKLMNFPVDLCMPGLHFMRMVVRHPKGAALVTRRIEENKEEGKLEVTLPSILLSKRVAV